MVFLKKMMGVIMVAYEDSSVCERVRPYYYDYLYDQSREEIPTVIRLSRIVIPSTTIDTMAGLLRRNRRQEREPTSGRAVSPPSGIVITVSGTTLLFHFLGQPGLGFRIYLDPRIDYGIG